MGKLGARIRSVLLWVLTNCVDKGRGRKPNVETRSKSSRPRDPKRCERPSSPCGGEGKTPRSHWLFHGRILGTLVGAGTPRRGGCGRPLLRDGRWELFPDQSGLPRTLR